MPRIHLNRYNVRYIIAVAALAFTFSTQRGIAQSTTSTTNTNDSIPLSVHQQKRQARKQRVDDLIRREEEGVLAYHKQWALGVKLATDGYGLSYEMGWMKTINRTSILQFELNEKKSPKQYKVSVADNNYSEGTSFIYGKQNYFYQFKVGYGEQRVIGGKGNRNGVAVSAIYAGGLSLGLLRPYYVQVGDSLGNLENIKYSTADSAEFLNPNAIYGGTGLGTGWGELKLQPGVHGKLALRFDYGKYNELLSAIEVGINAEWYTKQVPIMAVAPNHQFFFNSYVTILFGKRK